MKIQLLEAAESEFVEATRFYNREREGLGYEFALEVRRTLGRIAEFPQAWTSLSTRTRRCRTNRFPYGIIFQIRGESILVVAVMHLRRDPQSWKSRLPKWER